MEKPSIHTILEALLFAANTPISLRKLTNLLKEDYETESKTLKDALLELKESYDTDQRAFELIEIAGGYALQTRAEYFPILQRLYPSKPIRLSTASMEVLSIIAYKQPITKAEIESIRGVDCSNPLSQLIERALADNSKKMDAPGQPSLYETTPAFLEYFGLKNLKDLPKLPDEENPQSNSLKAAKIEQSPHDSLLKEG